MYDVIAALYGPYVPLVSLLLFFGVFLHFWLDFNDNSD
jgi:hypothetical protein